MRESEGLTLLALLILCNRESRGRGACLYTSDNVNSRGKV